MSLTREEQEELAALEREERERVEAEAVEAKRQHLEALRTSKRLAAKHGKPGHDFVVVETKVGNFAIRRPVDVEVDGLLEAPDDRGNQEKYACSILLEPTAAEAQALMAQQPGLVGAICAKSLDLAKVTRAEEAKK
jgi:hypothetical protein